MLINVRSINNKSYQLTEMLIEHKIDICGLTETWLRDEEEPVIADIRREGYEVISCPRYNKRGGGVAFLSKRNKYSTKQLKNTNYYNSFEVIQVLVHGKTDNIIFSTIYRTGYLNKDDGKLFIAELNDFLETVTSTNNVNIIWGDFNLKIDRHDRLSKEFLDVMEEKGFEQFIHKPTHIEGGILDLVFMTTDYALDKLEILDNQAISDHYPLKFEIYLHTFKLPTHFEIVYRNLSKVNQKRLKSDIKNSMREILAIEANNESSLDKLVECLDENITAQMDLQAPLVRKTVKMRTPLVATREIQDARRLKRRAENKYKKTRAETDKFQLKIQRKVLAKTVENAKNQFFKDKLAVHKNDVKQTYKIINQLLNKNQDKVFPSNFDETTLTAQFAEFYRKKIVKIRENLGAVDSLNEDNCKFVKQEFPDIEVMGEFELVSKEEIVGILNSLGNKQSLLDPMPCKLVKLCHSELAPVFTKIINSSFQIGSFPNSLKTAIITPIIKSKKLDSDVLNNYRPVSNLTILSKILEKCVLRQLTYHLNTNNLYSNFQSAYRLAHSCETALSKVYDDVLKYLSSTSYAILIFLDFSSAFDTIDHTILLERLEHQYGITNKVLHWFSSYLKNRNYRVKVNNTISNSIDLKYGVPQGSILGPVLFSLYIKDIEHIAHAHNINVHFYADDVQLYLKCNNNTDFTNLISCLENIQNWSKNNFLKLNNSKTKIMTLCSRSYKQNKIEELNVMGEVIKVESTVKNLGFVLDEHLSMCKQINQVCGQGYGMLRKLWKISKKLTDRSLRVQLVHSGILSRVNYCNSLYASLPNSQIKKLQRLINSSARFIFNIKGKDRLNHITPHLQQLHFLPMQFRIKFKLCLMVYKYFRGNLPLYLKEKLNIGQPIQNMNLRKDADSLLLEIRKPEKQDYKNRGISNTAPSLWNTLPFNLRNSETTTAFKSRLKTYFYLEWTNATVWL